MARTLKPGSVKLSKRQREALAHVRAKLGIEQKKLAEQLDWQSSAFSGAVSVALADSNLRAINPDDMRKLEDILRENLGSSDLKGAAAKEVEDKLAELFPPQIDRQGGRTMEDPGNVMPAHAYNRVLTNWDVLLTEYVVGTTTLAPPPRVWILGGPKTGKSSTIKKIETLADQHGFGTVCIDLRTVAEHAMQKAHDDKPLNVGDLLRQILAMAFPNSKQPNFSTVPPMGLLSMFTDTFKSMALENSAGRRMVITLDHLYMFGSHYLQNPTQQTSEFDHCLLSILLGFRTFSVRNATLFVVDDGSAAANSDLSQYWTKGKVLQCAIDETAARMVWECNSPDISENATANSVWAEGGKSLANPDASAHIDRLGTNIFLHHAAAYLAANQENFRDMAKASDAILTTFVDGKAAFLCKSHEQQSLAVSLLSFRRRLVAWLQLKARQCRTDYEVFCKSLAEDLPLTAIPVDDNHRKAELLEAFRIAGLEEKPGFPSRFVRDLARAEFALSSGRAASQR